MELIPGLPNDIGRECLLRLPFQSFPTLVTVSKAWNREIRSPGFHNSRRASCLTRPVFILTERDRVTHSLSIRLFDPDDHHRLGSSRLPHVPLESPAFSGIVGAGSNSVLVISSGWQQLANGDLRFAHVVHVLDILTGEWRRAADMPSHPDMWYGIGVCADPFNRKVLVSGGHGGQSRALRVMYDVAEDKWTRLDDTAKERRSASVVFHAGRFHVIGGYSSGISYDQMMCAEPLDPETMQWGPVNEGFLEQGQDGSAAYVANGDGDLYYVGKSVGVRRGGGDRWEEVARVPREAWSKKRVVTWKGKMLVLLPSYNYLLDLNTYEWSKVDVDSDSTLIEFGCGIDL